MQSGNNIKTILFDFDGTLRHHLPTGGEVFTDYVVDSLGMPVTEDDRRRAARWEHFYFANSHEIQSDFKNYNDEEDFWFHFAHRRLMALGCPPVLVPELGPKVSAYMRESYKPEVWIPEETHAIIPKLREAGYTLGVVSNRDNPYQKEINEMGMGDYFRFSLAAGEVDSWKPETGIFQAALKRSESTAQETIYIGDNYFADVVGARHAGLQPVLYDPKGLFHEPGCPVIASFDELDGVIKSI